MLTSLVLAWLIGQSPAPVARFAAWLPAQGRTVEGRVSRTGGVVRIVTGGLWTFTGWATLVRFERNRVRAEFEGAQDGLPAHVFLEAEDADRDGKCDWMQVAVLLRLPGMWDLPGRGGVAVSLRPGGDAVKIGERQR